VNADWVAGLYNLAFRFTGNDALTVDHTAALDIATTTMARARPEGGHAARQRSPM
jgi:hypothetical protein